MKISVANPLRSKIIIGARPSPETEALLRISCGQPADVQMSLCVFEVEIHNTIRYCCWAGGVVNAPALKQGQTLPRMMPIDGKSALLPVLTLAGQAAVEALVKLPFLQNERGFNATLVFQEITMGKTPLREKIIAAFRISADARAIIAFVGDLAGALDGKMSPAFNFDGAVLIADCKGMALPTSMKK